MSSEIDKDLNDPQPEKEPLGLLYGKIGKSIYHFLMYRLSNENGYEEEAERLLDEVISGVPDLFNTNFDHGLCGIGYGIEFLIQNNYVAGDSNNILTDFDDRIFRSFNENETNDLSLDTGLTGYLLYFLNRLGNKSDKLTYEVNLKVLKAIINKICAYMESYIDDMTRDFDFDMLRPFPLILNCFAHLLSLDIYKDKIYNTLKSWIMYLSNFYPNLHSNRLTFALSLYNINKYLNDDEIVSTIKSLLYSIDAEKIRMLEIEPKIQNIRHSWIGLLVILNNIENKLNEEFPKYNELIELKKRIINQYKTSIKAPLVIKIIESNKDFNIKTKDCLPGTGFIDTLLPYKFD